MLGEIAAFEITDPIGDDVGDEIRAGVAGVGVVGSAEDGIDLSFAEGVETVGEDLVERNELGVGLLRGQLGPVGVGFGVGSNDALAVADVAGDERADDGRGSLGLGGLAVVAEIPSEGVNGFLFSGGFDGAVFGFIAVALDAGARAVALEHFATIVVAKLHENVVSFFQFLENFVPSSLGEKRATAASADGLIDDGDFLGVEKFDEGIAPALLVAGVIADGGVADDPEGGFGEEAGGEEKKDEEWFHELGVDFFLE